ncbi:MAG: phytanoyl-CoA dioxygenase family protein [Pseudomonadota bacterium]
MFPNPLPGVPAIESPFFDAIFSQAGFSEETLRVATQLRDHGFAVIDFPEPDFDRLAGDIRRDLNDRFDWDRWRTQGHAEGDGLRLQDAFGYSEGVRRVATNPDIIRLLSQLFGRRAWPFQTLNFPVGTQQHIHTDAIHFSSVPERFMCGVWTALEDVDLAAGPLLYYPGSHRWPIYTNEHIGLSAEQQGGHQYRHYETLWRGLAERSGIAPQRFTPRKGQALIWLSNLLHGGDRQTDRSLTRWSQVTHYYFEDCAYYTPLLSDPFLRNVHFREMQNICTGRFVRNTYAGAEMPQRIVRPQWLDRWTRRAKSVARSLSGRG